LLGLYKKSWDTIIPIMLNQVQLGARKIGTLELDNLLTTEDHLAQKLTGAIMNLNTAYKAFCAVGLTIVLTANVVQAEDLAPYNKVYFDWEYSHPDVGISGFNLYKVGGDRPGLIVRDPKATTAEYPLAMNVAENMCFTISVFTEDAESEKSTPVCITVPYPAVTFDRVVPVEGGLLFKWTYGDYSAVKQFTIKDAAGTVVATVTNPQLRELTVPTKVPYGKQSCYTIAASGTVPAESEQGEPKCFILALPGVDVFSTRLK